MTLKRELSPSRTNHIYSYYCSRSDGPVIGEPVLISYDTFGDLFFAPKHVERSHWPADRTPGIVIGGSKISGVVGWSVVVLLNDGRVLSIGDSSLRLDTSRMSDD